MGNATIMTHIKACPFQKDDEVLFLRAKGNFRLSMFEVLLKERIERFLCRPKQKSWLLVFKTGLVRKVPE